MNPLPVHIASLRPYQSARSLYKGDGWIFMDANESPCLAAAAGTAAERWSAACGETRADVPSAAKRADLDSGQYSRVAGGLPPVNRYPDPTADALRQSVSAFYGLGTQNVMMANGSDELIDLAVRCFVRPGRNVAALFPSYGMYRVSAEANGAARGIRTAAARLRPGRGALAAALEGADLLFLCSPNNPTGTVLEPGLVERLAAKFPGLVVVDEAYGEFADAEGVPSAIGLVRRGVENLIVLRTFSKAFQRGGHPPGICRRLPGRDRRSAPRQAAVQRQRAQPIGRHGPLGPAVNVMEANVRTLIAGRTKLMRGCERLGCTVFPSTANFFLFRPPAGVSAQTLHEELIATRRLVLRRFAGTFRRRGPAAGVGGFARAQ